LDCMQYAPSLQCGLFHNIRASCKCKTSGGSSGRGHSSAVAMQELDVHSNRLTGNFPTALLDLMDLSELRLSHNNFRWVVVSTSIKNSS